MGHVYLYFGSGGGKTASALGLALRSVGHCHKVVIIQFMKWWENVGENRIKDRLRPYYEIYQFGIPGWIRFDKGEQIRVRGKRFQVRDIEDSDKEIAKKALEFAKIVLERKPHLLILDEICLSVHTGLLSSKEVLEVLEHIPEDTDIVMTGRYAPKELIDRANFVNEIVEIKSPPKFVTKAGIQY